MIGRGTIRGALCLALAASFVACTEKPPPPQGPLFEKIEPPSRNMGRLYVYINGDVSRPVERRVIVNKRWVGTLRLEPWEDDFPGACEYFDVEVPAGELLVEILEFGHLVRVSDWTAKTYVEKGHAPGRPKDMAIIGLPTQARSGSITFARVETLLRNDTWTDSVARVPSASGLPQISRCRQSLALVDYGDPDERDDP